MSDIGYEDCDWLSQETHWQFWRKFQNWTVEFHLPCRDPIDHLLSMCNHRERVFNCSSSDLIAEVERCSLEHDRYSDTLNSSSDFPNARLKCYNMSMTSTYIEYMGTILQKKRRQAEYLYRPTNEPRDMSTECLLHNATARTRVERRLRSMIQVDPPGKPPSPPPCSHHDKHLFVVINSVNSGQYWCVECALHVKLLYWCRSSRFVRSSPSPRVGNNSAAGT